MGTKRPIPFTLTLKGRNITFALITGSTLALTGANFGANTFFIDYYKSFVEYYSKGQPVPVPTSLQERCKKCMDLLKLPDSQRKLITPFSVYGYDLFHAGTTSSKFGVAVGIPVNFTYTSVDDMIKDNMQVNQKSVDFTTELGKKLADSLILPEKVQEFALCREILMTNNYKVVLESIYPFTCIFAAYTLSQHGNQKFNFYAAPRAIRVVFYSLISAFSLGVYYLLQDSTQVYYETEADKELCSLGPEYIKSGIIFYDKLLKRNQALRELMGKEGESKYTKLGNENFGIRQPSIDLMHRKMFFEAELKKLQSKEENLEYKDEEI